MSLTTVDKLKAELGITGTADDAYLADQVAQQSAVVEGYCNRSFAVAEQTQTFRLTWSRDRLVLSRAPITAVAEVTVDGVALATADYEVEDAGAGFLVRVDSMGRLQRWHCGVAKVRYSAGYATTPPAVEWCVLDLCVMAYQAKGRDRTLRSERVLDVIDQSWFDPDKTEMRGGLPGDIAGRLDPWRMVSV